MKSRLNAKKPLLQDQTPFFEALWEKNLKQIKKFFRDYKINLNEKYKGRTALSIACVTLRADIVKFLLKKGADINPSMRHAIFTEGTVLFDMIVYTRKKADTLEKRQQARKIIELLWNHQPQAHLHCFSISNSKLFFINLIEYLQEKNHTKSIALDLSHRDMNHSDLGELAYVLENFNTPLRSLDLSHNPNIGSRSFLYSGFQKLIHVLHQNKNLEYLNIKNCPLDKADILTLIDFLKERSPDSKLFHIEFDIAHDVFADLDQSDQAIIRATQKRSNCLSIINRCQELLKKYQPNDEKTETILQKSRTLLTHCKEIFLREVIDPYLEEAIVKVKTFIETLLKSAQHEEMLQCPKDAILTIHELACTVLIEKKYSKSGRLSKNIPQEIESDIYYYYVKNNETLSRKTKIQYLQKIDSKSDHYRDVQFDLYEIFLKQNISDYKDLSSRQKDIHKGLEHLLIAAAQGHTHAQTLADKLNLSYTTKTELFSADCIKKLAETAKKIWVDELKTFESVSHRYGEAQYLIHNYYLDMLINLLWAGLVLDLFKLAIE